MLRLYQNKIKYIIKYIISRNYMKKLVGFITASLPENNFTVDLALNMKEAGVDTLE